MTKMKMMSWLVGSMLPAIAGAQTAASEPAPAFRVAGAFFALSVEDLDASTTWYAEKLGMRVVMRATLGKVKLNILEGGGLMVELMDREGSVPLASVAPGIADEFNHVQRLTKVGVVVEDWDGLLAMLKARGVEIAMGPFPKRADQRANLLIKDNSGNLIQFFGR